MDQKSPKLIFLTGASGAGKTFITTTLYQHFVNNHEFEFLHFDAIGVPSEEEMINQFGSGAAWQKAMLFKWVERIIQQYSTKQKIIFEGQVNLDFIKQACKHFHIIDYSIVLIHCNHSIRHKRLAVNRQQAALINETMDNWANYLKQQALDYQVAILDTSHLTSKQIISWFKQYL